MNQAPRWQEYTRDQWWLAQHKGDGCKPLNRADINVAQRMAGTNERLDALDISRVYRPLAALILQRWAATKQRCPFVIGISGSVAVGKSTGARVLTALLRRELSEVELVTTDNFLKANHRLEEEGLLRRKGFPESYDQDVIRQFLQDLQQKPDHIIIPTYDHVAYTLVDQQQTIPMPKILVLEGVNVLQEGLFPLDFRIYFDADEAAIEHWYVQRFLTFRDNAFQRPGAYFQRYATLDDQEAADVARDLWRSINLVNLQEHIAPSKATADCILHKNAQHRVEHITLRTADKITTSRGTSL